MKKNTLNNIENKAVWTKIKTFVISIILLIAILYAFMNYRHYTKGLPPQRSENRPLTGNTNGPPPASAIGPPPISSENKPPQDRQQFRDQMAKDLNLTSEQIKKMDELEKKGPPSSPEEGRKRMEQMQKILTPEQQEKMRSNMRQNFQRRGDPMISRQLQRAEKILPPDQFEIFKKKLEELRNRFPGPGGPGGPGGPERPGGSTGSTRP